MYELFDHTADLGIRVRAADLPTVFAEAARGLFATIADPAGVRPIEVKSLRVAGDPHDYLLFDWLNELLYLFDTQHWLPVEFHVTLDDAGLSAELKGEPLDPSRHRLENEVKAITYHGLRLEQTDSGWLAEVIVDI